MATIQIDLPQLQALFFVFVRLMSLLMTIPNFDSRAIPLMFRIGLGVSLSVVLFPLLDISVGPLSDGMIPFVLRIIAEVLLGAMMGLAVRMLIAGITLAGQLAGYQMGLAIAEVIDPVGSGQVPLLGQLFNLIAMLIFLVAGGHHGLIHVVIDSFQIVPPHTFSFGPAAFAQMVRLGGNMFVTAIQVGAPVIAIMLITSGAMGLVARTNPQMNIFIVAMPLQIFIGLIFLILSLPYLIQFLQGAFLKLNADILNLMKAVA